MRSPTPLLLAALLLVTTVAGCLDPEEENGIPIEPVIEAEPAAPQPAVAQPIALQTSVPLHFPLNHSIDRTHWHNDTFAPEQTGLGGGFATGAFVQHIDLTPHVPPDVPTRLNVTVTIDAEQIPVAGPTARADPTSNQTVWYDTYWRNAAPGVFTFGGIVKRAQDGTIGINIEAYTPGPNEPPQVAYTARTDITARPGGIPLGVPTALTLNDRQTITFRTEPDNQAELLIYGPHDRLLDRLFLVGNTEWTVPRDASGELIVIPILGATDLRIHGPKDTELRALGLHRTDGQRHDLATTDTTSWDFKVDKRPLRILVTILGPGGEPWTCAGTLDLTLTGPEETILRATSDCPSPTNVPFLYEERHTWATHTGNPKVDAGPYTVTIDNTFWGGHQAYETVEWYQR